jgi:hypothetical protein
MIEKPNQKSPRSLQMLSVTHIEEALQTILTQRANQLAREKGFIRRQRKLSGADFVQTMVFGHLAHPNGSLETLAQTAQLRHVHISSAGLHQRLTAEAAHLLLAVLEELVQVLLSAQVSASRRTSGVATFQSRHCGR